MRRKRLRTTTEIVGFVKDWEIIADNLSKAGFSWGYVPAIDSNGRTIWIVDAHRDDGKRFVMHADEKLTAFLELESAHPEAAQYRVASYICLLTECWKFRQYPARAKSVGRLHQELHLTLFPQGNRERKARSHDDGLHYPENEKRN